MTDSFQLDSSAKAERTRSAILAAAEQLFARRGYAQTRLEDVADAVDLTRSALFYHFRDKEMLYDEMLDGAFSSLALSLEGALSVSGSVAERIAAAVEAWVDAMVARPTIARLLLRYIADSEELPKQRIYSSSDRIRRRYWALFEEGCNSGELKPLHNDPIHVASAVVGHTVFYISALSALFPVEDFQSLAPQQIAAHKEDVLHTVLRQLGIDEHKLRGS